MAIKIEDFDSITAPALPSGWTFNSPLATSASPGAGITPITSPNVLYLAATGTTTHYYGTYGTPDSNGGAVSVSGYFNADATTRNQTFGVTLRGSSNDLSAASQTYYWAQLDPDFLWVRFLKVISGTQTVLATVNLTALAVPEWYLLTAIDDSGNNVTVTVQRKSDSKYLNSSGAFQSGYAQVIALTDGSITGSGYAGLTIRSRSDNAYADHWVFDGAAAPVTLYSSDSGSGGDLLLAARMGGGDPATADSGSRIILPASESGSAGSAQLESIPVGDSGLVASIQLAAIPAGDSGSVDSAYLLSTFSTTAVYAPDEALGGSAELVVALGSDVSLDAEAFLATLLLVGLDSGSAASIELVSLVETLEAFASDPAFGSESAPAPTAWDTDAVPAWDAPPDPAPDSGSGGLAGSSVPDGSTPGRFVPGGGGFGLPGASSPRPPSAALVVALGGDPATAGSAAWWQSTILATDRGAVDQAIGAEAEFRSTVLYAVDSAASVEFAAIDLVTEGYHIYENDGQGGPIDYTHAVATNLGFDSTTWTSSSLAHPGTWKFGVRAFNSVGIEQNLDCAVTFVLDADGNDITNRPNPPTGLRAFGVPGGKIRVEWWYPTTVGPKVPVGFHVYINPGDALSGLLLQDGGNLLLQDGADILITQDGGPLDYSTPYATVPYSSGFVGSFTLDASGLVGGTAYSIGVRAYNASGEEQNTVVVVAVADDTGPEPVVGLTATAIV